MTEKSEDFALRRRAIVKAILARRGEMLVIGGLGSAAWDITDAGDSPLNFPLWGAMGGTVAIALGLAIAQPGRRVLALSGDGDLLMGVGSLATAAVQAPANLAIVALDNERYGETGGQTSHTAMAVDLVGVASACGIADTRAISTMAEVEAFARQFQDLAAGPRFANVKIDAANLERILPTRDGMFILNRLRGSLGFNPI